MTTETLAPAATRRLATALLFTPQQRQVPTGDRLDLRLSWADRAAVQRIVGTPVHLTVTDVPTGRRYDVAAATARKADGRPVWDWDAEPLAA